MGLFDGLKAMKDIVSGGIAAVKAGGKLDDIANEAMTDYEDVLSDEQKQLYAAFKKEDDALNKLNEENVTDDPYNAQLEKTEKARAVFVVSLLENSYLPKSFRERAKEALDEFEAANDTDALFEKAAMNFAKNDEEREEIHREIEKERNSEE